MSDFFKGFFLSLAAVVIIGGCIALGTWARISSHHMLGGVLLILLFCTGWGLLVKFIGWPK